MKNTLLALKALMIGLCAMLCEWSFVAGYSSYLGTFVAFAADPRVRDLARRRLRKLWEHECAHQLEHADDPEPIQEALHGSCSTDPCGAQDCPEGVLCTR